MKSTDKISVVVPNWNGREELGACLDALLAQSTPHEIIVVENGSTDGSQEFLQANYPQVVILEQPKNLGFAEGVNVGIRHALEHHCEYIALLNNDAVPEKNWLEQLLNALKENPKAGIATGKFMSFDKKHIDSTGDMYTTWGLAYPRGRGESADNAYDEKSLVFGATGGASLYRSAMLQAVGLFDKDFFAYYEDIDLSFRAQLAGWQVVYTPKAVAYHKTGATSSKIKGFTTYQTIKNYPWLLWKNVPARYLPIILPRFTLAYTLIVGSAIARGHGWYALKGLIVSAVLLPKKLIERRKIQKHKRVTNSHVRSVLTWDLPPNARRLRKLKSSWRKLLGKGSYR